MKKYLSVLFIVFILGIAVTLVFFVIRGQESGSKQTNKPYSEAVGAVFYSTYYGDNFHGYVLYLYDDGTYRQEDTSGLYAGGGIWDKDGLS